jgi:hypothetical protein
MKRLQFCDYCKQNKPRFHPIDRCPDCFIDGVIALQWGMLIHQHPDREADIREAWAKSEQEREAANV